MSNKYGRPKANQLTNDFGNNVTVKCKCGRTHEVARTWDVLQLVSHIEVNFCPVCEEKHEGERFEEKMVIRYKTLHGYRHRFNKHPVVNGREIELYSDRAENFAPVRKYGLWKGFLRNIKDQSGTWTWRYIPECVCNNRNRGNDWEETGGICTSCGEAIPTRKELREKKLFYDPEKSDKGTTG
jgi:hypothetical protein